MANYARFTLQDLKNRLTERVGNNSIFWVESEKGDAVLEAVLIWQALTGEALRTFPIPVSNGAFYDVPHQVDSVRKVTWNSTVLVPSSTWEFDMGFPGWQNTSGNPQFWAPAGVNMVAIYPSPTSGSLSFEGYAEVPRLDRDTDYIQLNEDSVSSILAYAHHYCTFKEGGQEFEDSMGLFQEFLKAAADRNQKLAATEFYRHFMGQYREQNQFPSGLSEITGGIRS